MNTEDLKLFQLTCGLGCFYVIAHTFDEAAKLLEWRLDKADYGYSSAREVSTITCMAVEHFYTNSQFFSGDNSNLIILNENDFVEDINKTEGVHESRPVCINNIEKNEYSDGGSVSGGITPQQETFDEIDDTDDGQPVDLGLPSGTKWMKSNIGATKPSDFGKFFQWGDTQGYEDASEHRFNWDDYKWGKSWDDITKYKYTDQLTTLEACDDSAVAATGGQTSMPTKVQLQELIDNTEHRRLCLANGVNGMKFWKKGTKEPTDGNSYIFIPAAGDCLNGSHGDVGSWGYVWSATHCESNAWRMSFMSFGRGCVNMDYTSRCFGYSVRAVVTKKT